MIKQLSRGRFAPPRLDEARSATIGAFLADATSNYLSTVHEGSATIGAFLADATSNYLSTVHEGSATIGAFLADADHPHPYG
ncbi:hypothetical protein [Mycobacterium tuberculosis]|uniref:hypothetical protein n=1 Tax=Mycobacterium tuberculosis TaxID=1773 RepID=UPI00272A28A0|nr:hypothetical protein [Mycobacterium tuberculosis]